MAKFPLFFSILILIITKATLFADMETKHTLYFRSLVGTEDVPRLKDIKANTEAESYLIIEKNRNGARLLITILIEEGSVFTPILRKGKVESLRIENGVIVQHKTVNIDDDDLSNLQFVIERNEIAHLIENKDKSWVLDRSGTSIIITLSEGTSLRVIRREVGESVPVDNLLSFVEWLSMI
ncbi:MAG: hypothetical protein LR015_03555 [Verrucomicrobia bacterium]|nr:hypothetical protein [Verrucomicrobiota bacterium]